MEIPNKREITLNHLYDTELKDFMKLYKDYNKEDFSVFVNGTILSSDNPLRFSNN